jgi:outer membrane protein OmpA-like peptidoglycan-associated protein
VASTILDNANLRLLRIEGHTDNLGDDAHNLDLSHRRAHAVMRALLDRGVDPARLKAMGYGETRPIANNKLSPGRAKNRRVEFMIEEQD